MFNWYIGLQPIDHIRLKRWYDVTSSFYSDLYSAHWWQYGVAAVGEKTVYLSNAASISFGLNEMFTILTLVGGIIVWIFIKIEKKYWHETFGLYNKFQNTK